MLDVYTTFAEEFMAVPVIRRQDRAREVRRGDAHLLHRGADAGQPRLQAGTSHHLGQNFAKAFELKFQNEAGEMARPRVEHVVGRDDAAGRRAGHDPRRRQRSGAAAASGADPGRGGADLEGQRPKEPRSWKRSKVTGNAAGRRRAPSVELDDRDNLSPGFKYHEWEMLGVPLRVELGPKDLQKGSVCLRDTPGREKSFVPMDEVAEG